MTRSLLSALLLFSPPLLVAAAPATALASAAAAEESWLDRSLPVPTRVTALLERMNREEKIAMTFATHTSQSIVRSFNRTGVGAAKFMSAFDCAPDDIKSCVMQRNALQKMFREQSRLKIPISFIK
jgi:hypothetical protein